MGQAQVTLRFEALLDSGSRVQLQPPLEAFTVEVTGSRFLRHTQQAKVTEEALDLDDIPPGGLALMTNRGSGTDWIDVRAESGGANLLRLLPGQTQLLRLTPGATPYVVASSSPVLLELLMLEA